MEQLTKEDAFNIAFDKFPMADTVTTDIVLEAMDMRAKQQSKINAIAFIQWAVNNHSVDYEGFSLPVWIGGEAYNVEQLYQLFIQDTQSKQL